MDYRYEELRIKSFDDWSVPVDEDRLLYPLIFAEKGFYYDKLTKHIKCFACNLICEEQDDPWMVHYSKDPTCEFLWNNNAKGNVPLITGSTKPEESPITYGGEASAEVINSLSDQQEKTEGSTATPTDISDVTPMPSPVNTSGEFLCKICKENPVGVVFLPCAHLHCCVGCAGQYSVCFTCATPIYFRLSVNLL